MAVPITQSLQGQRGGSPFISPAGLTAVPETEFLGPPYNLNSEIKPFNDYGNISDGCTVLMVDDNYLIYLHVSEILKRYKIETLYASSGIEAVEIIEKRNDISLILLDHHMPGLDGVSTLKEIRKINKNIPVVIQTGECQDSLNDYFERDGFDGVLGKPVDENLLIETVFTLVSGDKLQPDT
jgi:CheY-like chemotaxis protein